MLKINNLFDACVSHCNTLSGMAFVRYNRFYFCHGETQGMICGRNRIGMILYVLHRFGIKGVSFTNIKKDSEGWQIDFCRSNTLIRAKAFFNEECYYGYVGLRRIRHI